jgi:hypothetical protein
LEPNGKVQLIATHDRIEATPFVNAGCISPQTSVPHGIIAEVLDKISGVLFSLGCFGYMSIDLLCFPYMGENGRTRVSYMGIDIDYRMTDNCAVTHFFDILAEGQLDPKTGDYFVQQQDFTHPKQIAFQ